MPSRLSISAIIVLAAVVWGGSLTYFGVELSWDHAKPFSATVLVVTGILTVFDRILWRWLPFRLFHGVPDLSGKWAATLVSSYEGEGEKAPIPGTATITQTFSSFSIRLVTGTETKRNRSILLAERMVRHADGAYEIFGVYQSDPNFLARGKETEIHYGAFRYTLTESPPEEMNGHYWTDRNTKGTIQLKRIP